MGKICFVSSSTRLPQASIFDVFKYRRESRQAPRATLGQIELRKSNSGMSSKVQASLAGVVEIISTPSMTYHYHRFCDHTKLWLKLVWWRKLGDLKWDSRATNSACESHSKSKCPKSRGLRKTWWLWADLLLMKKFRSFGGMMDFAICLWGRPLSFQRWSSGHSSSNSGDRKYETLASRLRTKNTSHLSHLVIAWTTCSSFNALSTPAKTRRSLISAAVT